MADSDPLAELIADAWEAWHPVTEGHSGKPWEFIAARLRDAGVRTGEECKQVGWWTEGYKEQHLVELEGESDDADAIEMFAQNYPGLRPVYVLPSITREDAGP